MQRSRRIAVYGVVTGLLTAGTLTAVMPSAHANVAGFCNGSGTTATCTVTETITAPTSVTVTARGTVNGVATVSWKASCTLNGTTTADTGGSSSETPATVSVTLPVTNPASCTVSATTSLPTSDSANTLSVAMTYTTGASPSPSPSPTPTPVPGSPVKGYDGKCLDDTNNSSANDAKIQIWTCNGDKAQQWTYHSGELVHNGKCLNDQAWGGNRAKQILWTCNRALNELWTHLSNGEYVLNAKGYTLCLDDPAYSTKNGTQLIVYTCKDSSNQRWSLPTVVP